MSRPAHRVCAAEHSCQITRGTFILVMSAFTRPFTHRRPSAATFRQCTNRLVALAAEEQSLPPCAAPSHDIVAAAAAPCDIDVEAFEEEVQVGGLTSRVDVLVQPVVVSRRSSRRRRLLDDDGIDLCVWLGLHSALQIGDADSNWAAPIIQ